MLNPDEADSGVQPQMPRCDMLPQCPIWIPAAAPSAWMASVIRRRPGTISGRSHN